MADPPADGSEAIWKGDFPMGAWGTGFYSDDMTSDVRDTYLDLLRKKVPPEEAVARMAEEWKPDRDEECGYLFWLTIALLQWEYGHLPEERRERALGILGSGADEERWREAKPKEREKRREVMGKLEAKLRSEPEKVKRLRPYTHKRLPWKVGDVLSLRLGQECESWHGCIRNRPFDDLYTAAVIVDTWEQDIGDIYDIPVVAGYDWLGAEEAAMEDLAGVPFLRGDSWFRGGEEHKRYLHSVRAPVRWDYQWYDLKKIGHLEDLPSFPAEEWEYKKKTASWGAVNAMLVEEWLLRGREIPHRSTWNDPEAERARAWTRAQSYFKNNKDLLERMRVFIFEGEPPEVLARKRQEEWEWTEKRYSDPEQQKRLWRAIFEGEEPPYLLHKEKDS